MIDEFCSLKTKLLDRRDELKSIIESEKESTRPVVLDQQRVGRLSRMDALQSQAMSMETKRRRQIELTRIDAAVKRIDNGDYGYCVKCEEEISAKRLEIDPTAPFCFGCANKSEKNQ
ncbi:RNA polymerase-binding transcription factor DksA [hydrothermal vent metagenome]|uniref:RNA polymerase-binding transcription factor DksA n=1 Tax=hydrothermal vent metagenome TaxID=652676 RepID=A0A3B1BVI9_9ZZZZ